MKIRKILSCLLCLVLMMSIAFSINSFAYSIDFERQELEKYKVTEDGWRIGIEDFKNDIVGYEGELESVTIPTEIEGIAIDDVYIINNSTIKEAVVPEYFADKEISFYSSTALVSVTLPQGLDDIVAMAFGYCKKLTTVKMPLSLKLIDRFAFYGCEKLEQVTIPESVAEIGSFAFEGCKALKHVTIPQKCTTIGNSAFSGCESLEKIEILSSFINSIEADKSAMLNFYEDYEYDNMKLKANMIPSNFAYGCTSLKSINIPESVKSIGEGAFQNSGLTSITIPKNVKTIYKNAFKGCENLTSVKFAGAVNNIGKSAFSKCVNLKTVNFTKGYFKKVYDYAFYKCEKLDKITISNTKNVPTIAKSAFNKAKSGIKFYVKNNTVAKKLKAKLQKTNIKKAKIYRSAPILLYKNVG